MARVYRHQYSGGRKSRRWYVEYRNHAGKLCREPAYRDKSLSQQHLAKILDREERIKAGQLEPTDGRVLQSPAFTRTGVNHVPQLNLFLSWSGALSHDVAVAFRDWFPEVLPCYNPWISSDNIKSGKPWFSSITDQIGQSPVCIIFMTEQNALSPWLHLEAGGILMAPDPHVCPFLINLSPSDIAKSPLSQLQARRFEKDDTWKLVRDLNERVVQPIPEVVLRNSFDRVWPSIKRKVEKLIAEHQEDVQAEESELTSKRVALSSEAERILLEAADDPHNTIMMVATFEGIHLEIGSKELIENQSPLTVAQYKSAMTVLQNHGLIQDRGHNGEIFELTADGYRVADQLKKQRKLKEQE